MLEESVKKNFKEFWDFWKWTIFWILQEMWTNCLDVRRKCEKKL